MLRVEGSNEEPAAQCAMCRREAVALKLSHIIPNGVFRRIKQAQGSGQLVLMDDSEATPTTRSQSSWTEDLLCDDCEQRVSRYEKYGLELLREMRNVSSPAGVTFRSHRYREFKLFLTSLLWRAAVSKQDVFSKVVLPEACEEAARLSLLSGRPLGPLRLGCRISKLIDSSQGERTFDATSLAQLVISPIPRVSVQTNHYSVLFVIEGFLIEYFVKAIPFKKAAAPGIHRDSPVLFAPNICIFDIPEIVRIMATALTKEKREPHL